MKLIALASSILATTVVALGGVATPTVAMASPNDGVKCPSGYEGKFANGVLSCTKLVVADVSNTQGKQCDRDAPFVNFQRMALHQRDVCLNQDVSIPSNASLDTLANGRVVIRFPIGTKLGGRLGTRTPTIISGGQFVEINPNADFIFYDQSKTLQRDVAVASAKVAARERSALLPVQSDAEVAGTSVKSTPDAFGSLDKIEATVTVFAFAQRQ